MPAALEALADRAALAGTLGALPPATLLTSAEAATYLGTSMGVLANWRSLRHGPRYCGSGAFIRYRFGDLDDWMSTRASEVSGHTDDVPDTTTTSASPYKLPERTCGGNEAEVDAWLAAKVGGSRDGH